MGGGGWWWVVVGGEMSRWWVGGGWWWVVMRGAHSRWVCSLVYRSVTVRRICIFCLNLNIFHILKTHSCPLYPVGFQRRRTGARLGRGRRYKYRPSWWPWRRPWCLCPRPRPRPSTAAVDRLGRVCTEPNRGRPTPRPSEGACRPAHRHRPRHRLRPRRRPRRSRGGAGPPKPSSARHSRRFRWQIRWQIRWERRVRQVCPPP